MFRAFWIERPQPDSTGLVVHALLDSEACSGAFKLTLNPGETTLIDVEATIIARTVIEHVGVAIPLCGTCQPVLRGSPTSSKTAESVVPAPVEP